MTIKNYIDTELDILFELEPDNILSCLKEEIRTICNKFMNQELSGTSAPYYRQVLINTINDLLQFKPISPITGKDNEWIEIAEEDNLPLYQNKRLSSLFKKGNKCHYIDAIVFKNQNGQYFTSTFNKVSSHQPVNNFPFIPKTFIVDVIDKEDHFDIIDDSQVQEAFNYYQ